MADIVNPYYTGMGGQTPNSYGNYAPSQPDFSAYNTKKKPINSYLGLGQQAQSNGYGNYQPPGLNLDNPQGQKSSAPSADMTSAIVSGATGALGMAADDISMANQGFHFSDIAPSQTGSDDAPSYTAGQLQNEAVYAHPKGAQGGEILSGAGKGASTGASIGTAILPGAGTAIGAAVGTVAGAVGSIFGGEFRRANQQKQKDQALARVDTAQKNYNTQDIAYRNTHNALYNYYNQNNAAGREYNVYKSRLS